MRAHSMGQIGFYQIFFSTYIQYRQTISFLSTFWVVNTLDVCLSCYSYCHWCCFIYLYIYFFFSSFFVYFVCHFLSFVRPLISFFFFISCLSLDVAVCRRWKTKKYKQLPTVQYQWHRQFLHYVHIKTKIGIRSNN